MSSYLEMLLKVETLPDCYKFREYLKTQANNNLSLKRAFTDFERGDRAETAQIIGYYIQKVNAKIERLELDAGRPV